jgi:exodeoxyribonuclease VII large subunit
VGHETDWALVDFAADHRAPTPSAAAELVSSSRDELRHRVIDTGRTVIGAFADRISRARLVLRPFTPDELHRSYDSIAQPVLMGFDRAREELVLAMSERAQNARHALELATRQLESCSPYEVLRRGYAVVRDAGNSVVRNAGELQSGESVNVRLAHGRFDATVKETYTNEEL